MTENYLSELAGLNMRVMVSPAATEGQVRVVRTPSVLMSAPIMLMHYNDFMRYMKYVSPEFSPVQYHINRIKSIELGPMHIDIDAIVDRVVGERESEANARQLFRDVHSIFLFSSAFSNHGHIVTDSI